jgi:hypothetical protein
MDRGSIVASVAVKVFWFKTDGGINRAAITEHELGHF